jgi:hypothetical protein
MAAKYLSGYKLPEKNALHYGQVPQGLNSKSLFLTYLIIKI